MSKKFSDLTQLTTPATNDIFPVDDVSAGSTKYITLGDALNTPGAIKQTALGTDATWAWQSYTPTWTNGGTIGNGTTTAKYVQIGKTVIVNVCYTFGST